MTLRLRRSDSSGPLFRVGPRSPGGGTLSSSPQSIAISNYTTDGDGNVLSRACGADTVRLYWTAESQLAALKVVGGDSLEFAYDASGRLVRRKVNGAVQSHFLWQGTNLLAELNATATGKIAEYSYYPGLDNPHAVITGTTPHFAHVDGTGSVIALTDSNPTLQRSYEYDAWGTLTGGTDSKPFTNADRTRFKGAVWAGPEVDVYYMRARWYEPKTGRFLSEDPAGLAAGLNPYGFANADPVNQRDATGLDPSAWDGSCPTGYELVVVRVTYKDGTQQDIGSCQFVGGGGAGSQRGGDYASAFGMPGAMPVGWWGPGAGSGAAAPRKCPGILVHDMVVDGHTFKNVALNRIKVHGAGNVASYETLTDPIDKSGAYIWFEGGAMLKCSQLHIAKIGELSIDIAVYDVLEVWGPTVKLPKQP